MSRQKGTLNTTSFLSWDEFTRISKNLERDNKWRELALITAGVYTAQRICDLLKLRWVDFDKDELTITEKKTGKKRTIKLNPHLLSIIQKCFAGVNPQDKNQFIFLSESKNSVLTIAGVNYLLKKIFKQYNAQYEGNISSHLFRKTMARRVMENNNYDNKAFLLLSEAFNHSNITVTKRYLGIRKDEINQLYVNL